jgi:uncharacterized protein
MQFSEDFNIHAYAIRSYGSGHIIVTPPADQSMQRVDPALLVENKILPRLHISNSVIVMPGQLIENWEPDTSAELKENDFEAVVEYDPEVLILGTGDRIDFPSMQLRNSFIEKRIGLEVMDTAAACRTYNFLVADGRKVAAALFMLS